jgi:hypothetical protein
MAPEIHGLLAGSFRQQLQYPHDPGAAGDAEALSGDFGMAGKG